MKKLLSFIFVATLLFTLPSCEKKDSVFKENAFRVTFLRESDGCPAGPLVQFKAKDIGRLKQFLPGGYTENYTGSGIISAINLGSTYDPGKPLS
ncbi:hypothetical protein [Parapedobacter tibetensis]|uniref:hypothetical protein n=1 Tax=Parapedobacter tibetensis TaxID=2972951 RepID=UPI00214D2FDF|nr:hypothetical protein [Parapedobacter tibetensis]